MYQIPALEGLETVEERLDFLNQQLRYIATSATQAKARGDDATLARLLSLYNRARADAITLRAQANAADEPSSFLLALDRFSDSAVRVGSDAFGLVKSTLGWIPLVLVAALVVVGIGFNKGTLSVRR
jgi:hypothetical protein